MPPLLTWLLVGAGVLGLVFLARRPVLRALVRPLVTHDGAAACDAIVILNGNICTRPYRAAELYRIHRAPVLLARLADTEEVKLGVLPNISDATGHLLSRLGVREVDIQVLPSDRWVAGTRAEAVIVCEHIRAQHYRRVVIVTDAFHTRRARWTFRAVMGKSPVEFVTATTAYSLAAVDRWWRSEYGLIQVINEYVKFAYYRGLELSNRLQPPRTPAELPPEEPVRRFVTGMARPGR